MSVCPSVCLSVYDSLFYSLNSTEIVCFLAAAKLFPAFQPGLKFRFDLHGIFSARAESLSM